MVVIHRISPSLLRPTVLLETKSEQLSSDQTTLHHIALNVSLEDFESEKMCLEGLWLQVNATVTSGCMFGATAPLYFPDPERCPEPVEGGNLLEFVCYKAGVG